MADETAVAEEGEDVSRAPAKGTRDPSPSCDDASSKAPARRGRRGRRQFTKTQELLLTYLAGETVLRGGVRCTKRELADRVGRSEKTVDRCISDLRRRGLVEVEMRFDERGGQISSVYRVVFRLDG